MSKINNILWPWATLVCLFLRFQKAFKSHVIQTFCHIQLAFGFMNDKDFFDIHLKIQPYDRQPLLGNDLKYLNLLPGSVYWLIFMTFTANSKCCWVYEFDSCKSEDVRKMIMELIHLIKAGSTGWKDLILGLGMHHWSTMSTTAKFFIYLLLRDHVLK